MLEEEAAGRSSPEVPVLTCRISCASSSLRFQGPAIQEFEYDDDTRVSSACVSVAVLGFGSSLVLRK